MAVYGGGNTALDAARTAKRLGAEEAILIYRRDQHHMPAHHLEMKEALEEGVLTRWLQTVKHIDENQLTVEVMELDETGWPQPTGRFETLETNTLILAVGQQVDTTFLHNLSGLEISDDGVIQVDATMMTGRHGVFAEGDMVPAERMVTVTTGHGKKAARHIDAYLHEIQYMKPSENTPATFEGLNTWYYTDADQQHQPHLALTRRQTSFDEVAGGLDERTALLEARRCLSCGTCFECDNCYGMCAEEYLCGAIDMIKETS